MRKMLIVPILLAAAAACSPPTAQDAAKTNDVTMTEAAAPTAAAPISSTGTVTAIDAAAGTVTISHGPIAAISWPAMTMQFTAENPAILQGIAVGDHVAFELKSANETSTVTGLRKQ